MKTLRYSILFLLASSSLFAKELSDCSITLWPRFDWVDSYLEQVADEQMLENDFIVYPFHRGMVGSFRSEDYQIDKKKVLLQCMEVPSMTFLKNRFEKHQKGIGGVCVEQSDRTLSFSTSDSERRRSLRYLGANDQKLVYTLDKQTSDRVANLKFIADRCDKLIIFHERALSNGDLENAKQYFIEKCEAVKAIKQDVEVVVGFELKFNGNNSSEILKMIEDLKDNADGFLVVFDNSEHQKKTAIDILRKMRA